MRAVNRLSRILKLIKGKLKEEESLIQQTIYDYIYCLLKLSFLPHLVQWVMYIIWEIL